MLETWWRHQMETFSSSLALCAGNSPATGEFPTQRPVTRSFDVFFIYAWINDWVNNRAAGDLRRHRAHQDVIVMDINRPEIQKDEWCRKTNKKGQEYRKASDTDMSVIQKSPYLRSVCHGLSTSWYFMTETICTVIQDRWHRMIYNKVNSTANYISNMRLGFLFAWVGANTNLEPNEYLFFKENICWDTAARNASANHELYKYMMTSWNGSISRVTCPLCGKFTGDRWIPRTKGSDGELWCFLWYAPEQMVE